MDMLYDVVRPCLSVMLGWKIGAENDWSVSVGKSDKYMNRYLTPEIWHRYLETVPSCEYEAIKHATETMIDLFEETARQLPNIWEQRIIKQKPMLQRNILRGCWQNKNK